MKSFEQIYRYTSDCKFTTEDWNKIVSYCREHYKGNKLCRARTKKPCSTYERFLDWIDNGYGSGDMVSYGNTMGIVGSSVPNEDKEIDPMRPLGESEPEEKIKLVAYCDFNGNLIVNDMIVRNPERLHRLSEDGCAKFMGLIHKQGMDYFTKEGKVLKVYTPEKYFYVTINKEDGSDPDVGIYLESDGYKHHYMALLKNDELKMDCWSDDGYTPLRSATLKDIRRLHTATAKAGFTYNERLHTFIPTIKRGLNNIYWYLNDRFEIVMDRDNGSKKHSLRYNAGNYFIDYQDAIAFMLQVQKLRGKN